MINLVKSNKTVSRNTNSRNKRKVLNGFKGESTPSGWIKTSLYGTIKHKQTSDELRHFNKIQKFRVTNPKGKHPGSKRTLYRY